MRIFRIDVWGIHDPDLFGSLDEEKKPGVLQRMREAVSRTRESLTERIEDALGVRQRSTSRPSMNSKPR